MISIRIRMTNTLIVEHLVVVSLGETNTITMQETCWLISSILHTNYVQLGQQLTVSQCFVPMGLRVSTHKLGVELVFFCAFC